MNRQTITFGQRIRHGTLVSRSTFRWLLKIVVIVAVIVAATLAVYNGYDFGLGAAR